MMVCKVAQIKDYGKVVQIAALLHDIGKPNARRVDHSNNQVQFFNHEIHSAYLSIEILHHMIKDKMINKEEFLEIFSLIAFHSILHVPPNQHKVIEQFKFDKSLYIHILELSRCDNLGRFYEKSGDSLEDELPLKGITAKLKDDKQESSIQNTLKNSGVLDKKIKHTFEGIKSLVKELTL
jgi:hypothetical protein